MEKFWKQELEKLKEAYWDPYMISYSMMLSAQTQADRFRNETLGPIGTASIPYLKFVEVAIKTPKENEARMQSMQRLGEKTLQGGKLLVGYRGGEAGYRNTREALQPLVQGFTTEKGGDHALSLPLGYPSALTLPNQQENVSHLMQTGYYGEGGYQYSGKLRVLGRLLSTDYLIPTLRGKLGAYGAGAKFTNSNMVFSTSGLSDIDQAIEVYSGAGSFLRNLKMTQEELNQLIIAAVNEFDQQNNVDGYYGDHAELTGATADALRKEQDEILSTTIDDLKGFADFVDGLLAQKRVFAVVNQNVADNTLFPFAYQVDAAEFTITPLLN